MRNRNEIIELNRRIDEATSHWEYFIPKWELKPSMPVAPLESPFLSGETEIAPLSLPDTTVAPRQMEVRVEQGTCKRCGGEQYAEVNVRHLNPRYCPICFPGLNADIIELKARLDQQKPRDDQARRLKYHRHSMAIHCDALPPVFQSCEFRTYISGNESQTMGKDQLQRWVRNRNGERQKAPFFYLHGSPGVGKSHLLAAAYKTIMRQDRVIPEFLDERQFYSAWLMAQNEYSRPTGGQKPEELIRQISTAPILILDDLGICKLTDTWGSVLFAIIDHRWSHRLPTLFSSNLTPDQLVSYMTLKRADRVLSGVIREVTGKSRRGITL